MKLDSLGKRLFAALASGARQVLNEIDFGFELGLVDLGVIMINFMFEDSIIRGAARVRLRPVNFARPSGDAVGP